MSSSLAPIVHTLPSETSLISKLPDDVFCLIFAEVPSDVPTMIKLRVCGYPSYCKRTFQLVPVTHVCRRWRTIALGMASLWTSIYDSSADGEINDSAREAFLARSKDASLHIASGHPESPFFQTLLTSHASRMKSLVISPHGSNKIVTGSSGLCAPRLERLVLCDAPSRSSQFSQKALPLLFQGVIPKLRSLTLDGRLSMHRVSWTQIENLTYLEISGISRSVWTSDNFIFFVKSLSSA